MAVQTATITCPHCGYKAIEPIPINACLYFYVCKACKIRLKPKHGDCCVFSPTQTAAARIADVGFNKYLPLIFCSAL